MSKTKKTPAWSERVYHEIKITGNQEAKCHLYMARKNQLSRLLLQVYIQETKILQQLFLHRSGVIFEDERSFFYYFCSNNSHTFHNMVYIFMLLG